MNMKQILQMIVTGKISFEPSSDSEVCLREFQHVATLILKAKALGYVIDVIPHQESETGNDYYDTMVVGEITKSGRQFAGEP